ncbi:hypothetical protein [Wocania ichthyoenteri]|uniref:hypothetical protein n=1 Tax=Wocania ichthyoenteri TaxID=1230531 RepID=UPI00053E3A6F|nr:hypothetical protein [Wocania ichthyoenteri]
MEHIKTDIIGEISKLTRIIEDQYPELQKYLDETRGTLPQGSFDSGKIKKETLEEYRDSLKELIQGYDIEKSNS